MQINRYQQPNTEVISNASAKLVDTLPAGQKMEATVIARVHAEQVKLHLGDTVVHVHTQQDLSAGQKVIMPQST